MAQLGHFFGCGVNLYAVQNLGVGRHRYYLTQDQYTELKRIDYGQWIQTFFTLMFTKISICLFFLRITIIQTHRVYLLVMIAVLVITNVILTFMWVFQCSPVDRAWEMGIPGRCLGKGYVERVIFAQARMLLAPV